MNNLLKLVYIQLAPHRPASQISIIPNVLIGIEVMKSFAHS